MNYQNPESLLDAFFAAFNAAEREEILAMYEAEAVMLPAPGQRVQGREAIATALDEFLALRPRLQTQQQAILLAGDIAQAAIAWTMSATAPDGQEISMQGTSSDVLRRQNDGSWRFVVDNPWGTGILA